jgi:hypothetical protein
MRIIFSLGVFVASCVITLLVSFWLGGSSKPLSKEEFFVLWLIIYGLLMGAVYLFKKIFKKKEE